MWIFDTWQGYKKYACVKNERLFLYLPRSENITFVSSNEDLCRALGFRIFPRYFFRVNTTPSLHRVAAVNFGAGCREDALVRDPTIADPYVKRDQP